MIELDHVLGIPVKAARGHRQRIAEPSPAPRPRTRPMLLLEPLQRKQVPWSVRVLRGIAWACFAVAYVAAFAAGAVALAWLMEAGGAVGFYPVAFLVYGGAFMALTAKLKL